MLKVRARSTAGWPEWLIDYYERKPADEILLGYTYFDFKPIPVICHQHALCGFIDSQNRKYKYFEPYGWSRPRNEMLSSATIQMKNLVKNHPVPQQVQKDTLIKMITKEKGGDTLFYWDWGLTRTVPSLLCFQRGHFVIYIKTVNKEYENVQIVRSGNK